MWFEERDATTVHKGLDIKDNVRFLREKNTDALTEKERDKTNNIITSEEDDFDLFGVSMD